MRSRERLRRDLTNQRHLVRVILGVVRSVTRIEDTLLHHHSLSGLSQMLAGRGWSAAPYLPDKIP